MSGSTEAIKLKNEGNSLFSKRDYAGAESCYSRAYVVDLSSPGLLTRLWYNKC